VSGAFTPVETGDGSSTFYSETFGEWFHNRNGACQEAQTTYVEASGLARRVQQPASQIRILDICYGLGYNTAAALETIWALNENCPVDIRALEIDPEPAKSALAQRLTQPYSASVQQVLYELANQGEATQNGLSAQMLWGDARQHIQPLITQSWQADIIFLDPFSPPHCPQLWTVEFLGLVAQCLNPTGGILVTYSCAAAVRAALKLAGLSIGPIHTSLRKWPGTIASHGAEASESLPALSQKEQAHLQTKAAIPYRDPTLQSTAPEILERRVQEQANSPLMPTKQWRSHWASQEALSPEALSPEALSPKEG
jgi:tRNA U34 5-methylaminomethyl-2-thiouridine-forming methyltransferase MnmC